MRGWEVWASGDVEDKGLAFSRRRDWVRGAPSRLTTTGWGAETAARTTMERELWVATRARAGIARRPRLEAILSRDKGILEVSERPTHGADGRVKRVSAIGRLGSPAGDDLRRPALDLRVRMTHLRADIAIACVFVVGCADGALA